MTKDVLARSTSFLSSPHKSFSYDTAGNSTGGAGGRAGWAVKRQADRLVW